MELDWNKIGMDLVAALTPFITLISIYYIKAFLVGKPAILVNALAFVLAQGILAIQAYIRDNPLDPLLGFLLASAATYLAEILASLGVANRVKKVLRVKGSKKLVAKVEAKEVAA